MWPQIAFWVSVNVILFSYIGYPVLLFCLIRILRIKDDYQIAPTLKDYSIVLVVRNEQERIAARITNLLNGSSQELQRLIIVLDGCTDNTFKEIGQFKDHRIVVIEQPSGKGKPAGLNAGIQAAQGEVVVLCDVRQRFEDDTISRLVSWFNDPTTGAVSGSLEIEKTANGTGQGIDIYWRLEKWIRQLESMLDSSIGCSGSVCAIRRSAYVDIPEDTILDDVVIPMEIARSGLRVRFCPSACAFDPQPLSGKNERRRKVRTLAGNFQMMFRYLAWMLPNQHRLWWKLILHKYLRLMGPCLLVILFVTSMILRDNIIYMLIFFMQLFIFATSLIIWNTSIIKNRILTMFASFVFLQWCVVQGFVYWLTKKSARGWK
jgi:cellulose synthase/poly-beta-1,6-N-acetylglucosamine synthase-like glycosyltransferase